MHVMLLSLMTQLLLRNFGISCKTSLIIASHRLKSRGISAQAERVLAGTVYCVRQTGNLSSHFKYTE